MSPTVRTAAALLSLTLTGSLAAAGPAWADSSPPTPHSGLHASASAKAAGITRAGWAYMGWSLRGHAGARPGAVAPKVTTLPGPAGIDVSAWNPNVNWSSEYADGTRFAYVKATEGNYYTSSTFTSQYNGSHSAGLTRGAYHFANPSVSSGAGQADYFVNHGGGWSPYGRTLPGVLDIEYDPYGPTCYGLSDAQMTSWIASFTNRYKQRTGRDAVIYTTYDWWTKCTGNTTRFNQTNPLWIAHYSATPGTLPGGWGFYTFWQHSATPVDQDWFNGSLTRLHTLARGACALPIHKPSRLRALHYGMTGSDVTYLQRVLNALGDRLAVDGSFGPGTLRAVKDFQSEQHIAVDGSVGPITWSHLKTALNAVTCIDSAP